MNKEGKSPVPRTPIAQAVLRAYGEGKQDELLEPYLLVSEDGQPVGRVGKGDSVIFYNIRGEREIELTQALTEKDFPHFETRDLDLAFTTMIRYRKDLDARIAFPPEEGLANTLAEVLSKRGKRVVKITEAEKAVHLAYFLNGKREEPFAGEERIVVPTRKDVATFDEAPEMSAEGVTAETCRALADESADVIAVNLCNVDVVGHYENEQSVLKAIETVDASLGKIIACARERGVASLITADHGTVEHWLYPEGAKDTGHTSSPVPCIIDFRDTGFKLRDKASLSDVAPTILDILQIPNPPEMTGESLIKGQSPSSNRALFLILDGWGHSDSDYGNMISKAATPNFDRLWNNSPHTLITASGEDVGMPAGSVGNSEVGHLHLGAGRTVLSDRLRIDRSIEDGSFADNEAFLWAVNQANRRNSALHLLGIVSFYSSHGSVKHLQALMRLCKSEGVSPVYIHGMLGRRGERPEAGARYMGMLEEECAELGVGKVAGVIGRYWSMDREENWDRIERTYRWLVEGEGVKVYPR
ncbi:phosphoglycerate mutase (2,3-diphosphoglycerate-independent) [candidate division WOR-3 bacterium]|uniref:phosphoglycerate mutase (2,3-diphosphoglycerate-independent) n=1 Tax=candidate division WOR-3 bacterium TaxID=2052148 RepID=A0A9D5QCG2_UNCW3|nr:phosphoglycerate mutase (2,3-diphosphoglycerate-independent) [candidate division WOR-3 bacterium]MBD3364648.1 phosphoglycerate mutase (2,3-diphosphoglycerate-independent) [candidate division WOR-3 bacterium]